MIKPDSCAGCPLEKISNGFSVPEGSGSIGIHVVGEGLGDAEYKDGKPFRPYAQAGSLLEQTFKRLGFSRQQFKLWNLIACQPPGNELARAWYEERAVNYCKQHFDRVIPRNGKNVIFATGNLPLKYLTAANGDAKQKQSISYLRGFVLKSDYGLVIPSFHPAFIRRGKAKYTEVFERDLMRAVKVARGEWEHPHSGVWRYPEFQDSPGLDDVKSFYLRARDSEKIPIGCDIETPHSKDKDSGDKGDDSKYESAVIDLDPVEEETDPSEESEARDDVEVTKAREGTNRDTRRSESISTSTTSRHLLRYSDKGLREPILTVQFSLGESEGISIPYQAPYIEWIHRTLALPNVKLWWNGYWFDIPRLLVKGVTLGGPQVDLMWLFHHWQPDLDRNLQFVASYYGWAFPWKHYYGKRLGWYGCVDVAVLHWIRNRAVAQMKEIKHPVTGVSCFDGWRRYVHDVWPLLDDMAGRGVPINGVEREKVKGVLVGDKGRLLGAFQDLVPLECRSITPKRKVKMK